MSYKSDLISHRLFRRLFAISIAATLDSSAFAAANKQTVNPKQLKWYSVNQGLFNAGKYQEVLKNLEPLKLKGPQEALRRFLLARTYAKLKRHAEAANLASQAFDLDQTMMAAKFNEVCYLSLAGKIQYSVSVLETLESLVQKRSVKERKTIGQAIKSDPDLENIRKHPDYKKLVEEIALSLINNTPRQGQFAGCALKDKSGKIVELKDYDCADFNGSHFLGPTDSCEEPWVKIDAVVPLHLIQKQELCIYVL